MSNSYDYATIDYGLEDFRALDINNGVSGKYTTTVKNVLSKHYNEIKSAEEDVLQPLHTISKKKLKELVTKQNNELFSFLNKNENTTLGVAETIFRRYGQDVPTIKGFHLPIGNDLYLDTSISPTIKQIDESIKKLNGSSLDDFIKQMKWVFTQYKLIGEEILRLELALHQKIDMLDKLHNRIPLINNLENNNMLPELIESFSKYTKEVFVSSNFENDYKELIELYKKWNIYKEIISYHHHFKTESEQPLCSICINEAISQVIVPCGHTFCSTCSKKQQISCYICRGNIREKVKVFFT